MAQVNKSNPRTFYGELENFSIFSYQGKKYVKIGDSHAQDTRKGKDVILSLKDKVIPLGRANVCAI